MSAVTELNAASGRAVIASQDFQNVVEGDDTTTVVTSGGRSLPTISKWFKDSYNSLSSFISTEADRAEVSANSANTSKDNANTDALLAKDWASRTQGFKVDGVRYSAFHYSLAANTAKTLAETSASNSATSASNSATSASNSYDSEVKSLLWATHAVDDLVPGELYYSARHYAKKAEDFAAVIGGGIALTNPYTITGNSFPANPTSAQIRRISSNGSISGETFEANDFIIYDHTSGSNQWFKLTTNGISKTQYSLVNAATTWRYNKIISLGDSADMSLSHNGTDAHQTINQGNFYLTNLDIDKKVVFRAQANSGQFSFLICDPAGALSLSRSQSTISLDPSGTLIETGTSNFSVNGTGDTSINSENISFNASTTLTINTNDLRYTGETILLDSDVSGSPNSSNVCGITINRGSFPNRRIYYEELDDVWKIDSQRLYADNYHPEADSLSNDFTISLTGKANGSITTNGTGVASIAVTNVNASSIDSTPLSQLYKVGVGLNYMTTGLIELGSGSFTDGNLRFLSPTGGSSLTHNKDYDIFTLASGAQHVVGLFRRSALNKPSIIQNFNMNTSGNPVLGFYVHAYNGAKDEILGGYGNPKTNSSSWMELTESALTIHDEDLIVGDASTTKFHVDMVNKKLSLTDMSLEIDGDEVTSSPVITSGTVYPTPTSAYQQNVFDFEWIKTVNGENVNVRIRSTSLNGSFIPVSTASSIGFSPLPSNIQPPTGAALLSAFIEDTTTSSYHSAMILINTAPFPFSIILDNTLFVAGHNYSIYLDDSYSYEDIVPIP